MHIRGKVCHQQELLRDERSFPGSGGTSVGVGNFDTEAYTFSAEITFGHSGTSFVLSESQRSYYIKLQLKKQVFIGIFSKLF